MKKEIAQLIKDGRKKSGLTQEELAVVMDVCVSTIVKWEAASVMPSFDKGLLLFGKLGIDVLEMAKVFKFKMNQP